MKKKYIIEIAIAGLLALAEIAVVLCFYSEAQRAQNPDLFLTAIIAVFTNVEVLYGIGLIVINSDWRKNREDKPLREDRKAADNREEFPARGKSLR